MKSFLFTDIYSPELEQKGNRHTCSCDIYLRRTTYLVDNGKMYVFFFNSLCPLSRLVEHDGIIMRLQNDISLIWWGHPEVQITFFVTSSHPLQVLAQVCLSNLPLLPLPVKKYIPTTGITFVAAATSVPFRTRTPHEPKKSRWCSRTKMTLVVLEASRDTIPILIFLKAQRQSSTYSIQVRWNLEIATWSIRSSPYQCSLLY